PTVFADALDIEYSNTIPYDLRFFELLDRFVQREPWFTRDKAMIDTLRAIGIEKGKPFEPDVQTQDILTAAIAEAHAWLDMQYEHVLETPFASGSRWAFPVRPDVSEGLQTNFANPDSYPLDGRGVAYSMAYFSAKHIGQGQYYLITLK